MDAYTNMTVRGYELREPVGAGSSGVVYRAYQSSVQREVAVKIIRPQFANQPAFVRRFEVEAQLVARLEHPHIVPLFDYWRDPSGAYLVMRWLPSSLRHAIQQGIWPATSVAHLLDQLAAALTIAHRDNVIHRDLKPDNILLDEDGNGYLADFSIAKDLSVSRIDEEGIHALGYLSPEQIRNEMLTPRTDIYSLGYVLYELLTGERAFPDATTRDDYIDRHLNAPIPSVSQRIPQIPAALDEVIQTATAKDPVRRYANALRFAAAFRAALPITAPRRLTQPLADPLTGRELDVLRCMVSELTNSEIAEKLYLSHGTVKWYVKQIYSKLDAHSRHEAIDRAQRLHLTEPSNTFTTDSAAPARGNADVSKEDLVNPYKGLRPFQEVDAADFFGRAGFVEQLLNRLSEGGDGARFLLVTGPSGSGKSSLVKAGLIPALRNEGLNDLRYPFIAEMLPGTHPLEELEAALLRVAVNPMPGLLEQLRNDRRGLVRTAKRILPVDPQTELFLIVDQFEELFTLVEDEAVRKQFIDQLLSAAFDPRGRVRIVITLRADFYDRPLLYPRLAKLVHSYTAVIVPLSAREMEQAIVAPAERVGVLLEEGLLTTIIHDVSEQPGALPLLQYALTELFKRREGLTLTLDAYHSSGGVLGALGQRADEIYAGLDPVAQALARQIFLRLSALGEGMEETRRRAPMAEVTAIGEESAVEDVVNAFADARLLTFDHDPITRIPTVEIAHEALLREWRRLREWLADAHEEMRVQRRLRAAADEWQVGKDASWLATGARLTQFKTWLAETTLVMTPGERAYLDASLAQQERLAQQEEERKAHAARLEKRSRSFLRLLVAVFAVAAVIATGLSVTALNLGGQAARSAEQFRSTALANGAQQELLNGHPDVALALAQEAMNMVDPPPQSELMFFQAATSSWIKQRYVGGHTSSMFDVVYFPDGERMVTSGFDGRAVVWDIATGEQVQSVQYGTIAGHLAVHPDGDMVAIGSDGTIMLWRLDTGAVTELDVGETRGRAPVFNHGGNLLLGGTQDGNIFVWDVATHERLRTFASINAPIFSISFNPDETLLIAASQDGAARIWDFETGELIQTLDHPALEGTSGRPWVWEALFLPDGERVISCDTTATIRLWNWRSGAVDWETVAPVDPRDLALSPDGTMFFTGADPALPDVHLWDTETGTVIRSYRGHTTLVNNVDFSPDGTTQLSASHDGTAVLWPVQWEGAVSTFMVPGARNVAVHPSKPLIAVTIEQPDSPVSPILLMNPETGEIIRRLDGNREFIQSLAFSPDGRLLVSGDAATDYTTMDDQDAYVWDVETGERLGVLENHEGWVQSIAFSPDGQTVAIGEATGARIILWDLETFTRTGVLEGHQNWVTGIAFGPDGRYLYSGSRDGGLFQWDVESGEIIRTFAGHDTAIYGFDLSADGTLLFTGASDGTARAWDTATGAALFNLEGHTSSIDWLDYSPSQNTVVTTSTDGTLILWDAATGERLRRYVTSRTEEGGLFLIPASFSAEGHTLISGYSDQLVLWDASPVADGIDAWVRENRYIASFNCEQRALYLIEPLCEQPT